MMNDVGGLAKRTAERNLWLGRVIAGRTRTQIERGQKYK